MLNKNDYIDAEIVAKIIDDEPYYEIKYYDKEKDCTYIGYSSYDIINVINWFNEFFVKVPKIDVAKVIHASWEVYDDGYEYYWRCSNCNHIIDKPYGVSNSKSKKKYCHFCGALMDKE